MPLQQYPTKLDGEPAQHIRLPFIVPAPLYTYKKYFEKFFACLQDLLQEASKQVILPPAPRGAVRYGVREKTIITVFNIKIRVKVQRYKLLNGRTCLHSHRVCMIYILYFLP